MQSNSAIDLRSFNINFGPQHPASHGVLRIILQMRGELIERADTHIGLLHRGTEKLIEERTYLLGLPYFDRLDYTSILIQEHAYCLAVEDLLGSNNYLASFAQVRILFDELTRILNHLILMSTHSMDVGTMAIFFWAFEERERIMEFYERVSGARMHAAFYRPNELSITYITTGLLKDILFFCRDLFKRMGQIESKLNSTTIWRARLSDVGVISPDFVYEWGVTGPLARSAGIQRDLRLSYVESYANYFYLDIRSFTGDNGDCYDRFLIRMREMAESIHIIVQIISI
jgi:NADH:ubiquinone oxidoreductase subunit D